MIKAPDYHDKKQDNKLLGALSDGARARLQCHLRPIKLPAETALYEAGDAMEDVFLPTDAIPARTHSCTESS